MSGRGPVLRDAFPRGLVELVAEWTSDVGMAHPLAHHATNVVVSKKPDGR
jgi:hypothetical protein